MWHCIQSKKRKATQCFAIITFCHWAPRAQPHWRRSPFIRFDPVNNCMPCSWNRRADLKSCRRPGTDRANNRGRLKTFLLSELQTTVVYSAVLGYCDNHADGLRVCYRNGFSFFFFFFFNQKTVLFSEHLGAGLKIYLFSFSIDFFCNCYSILLKFLLFFFKDYSPC